MPPPPYSCSYSDAYSYPYPYPYSQHIPYRNGICTAIIAQPVPAMGHMRRYEYCAGAGTHPDTSTVFFRTVRMGAATTRPTRCFDDSTRGSDWTGPVLLPETIPVDAAQYEYSRAPVRLLREATSNNIILHYRTSTVRRGSVIIQYIWSTE